jgi:hypothetical protein
MIVTSGGIFSERGNKYFGFINDGDFLNCHVACQEEVLSMNGAVWKLTYSTSEYSGSYFHITALRKATTTSVGLLTLRYDTEFPP